MAGRNGASSLHLAKHRTSPRLFSERAPFCRLLGGRAPPPLDDLLSSEKCTDRILLDIADEILDASRRRSQEVEMPPRVPIWTIQPPDGRFGIEPKLGDGNLNPSGLLNEMPALFEQRHRITSDSKTSLDFLAKLAGHSRFTICLERLLNKMSDMWRQRHSNDARLGRLGEILVEQFLCLLGSIIRENH